MGHKDFHKVIAGGFENIFHESQLIRKDSEDNLLALLNADSDLKCHCRDCDWVGTATHAVLHEGPNHRIREWS
jgi:hypothetical protein